MNTNVSKLTEALINTSVRAKELSISKDECEQLIKMFKNEDELRFENKLNLYVNIINSTLQPVRNELMISLGFSYNSFKRHLEYLKYTKKTVKRNCHLKALHNIEQHLDFLLGI